MTDPAVPFDRIVFIRNTTAISFAVAVDPKERPGWTENEISGDHIIEVLTESVSDAYLLFLRKLSVSYVFAGETVVDFGKAIQQLTNHFPNKVARMT